MEVLSKIIFGAFIVLSFLLFASIGIHLTLFIVAMINHVQPVSYMAIGASAALFSGGKILFLLLFFAFGSAVRLTLNFMHTKIYSYPHPVLEKNILHSRSRKIVFLNTIAWAIFLGFAYINGEMVKHDELRDQLGIVGFGIAIFSILFHKIGKKFIDKNFAKSGTTCSNCGKVLEEDGDFCIYCGNHAKTNSKSHHNSSYKSVDYQIIVNDFDGLVIALLAKLSKSDGKISKEEANFLSNTFDLFVAHREDKQQARDIYKQILSYEKEHLNNTQEICDKLLSIGIDAENKKFLLELMLDLAHIDNEYHIEEENFIVKIINLLDIDFKLYKLILKQYENNSTNNNSNSSSSSSENFNPSLRESYEILESSENMSDEEIKRNYKRLVRQYHVDMLQSKDLPKDMIKFAEEKLKSINAAYAKIKKNREHSYV